MSASSEDLLLNPEGHVEPDRVFGTPALQQKPRIFALARSTGGRAASGW